MAELKICFNCVQPLLLKLVGAKFLHQAYASALLMFVDDDSCTVLRNCTER